ncbi:MAG: ABC transporter permease subunit [Planctomycetia bacterium]|nr:ABC transporter permease subunit [Planctomycetia bacterium]
MTVHARGYRPLKDRRRSKGLRFVPIFREARRDAMRGVLLLVFRLLCVLLPLILIGFFLYFQSGPLSAILRQTTGGMQLDELTTARETLSIALLMFHDWTALWIVLLSLFVGAGVIADDLRTRALPLYLVRPITPIDYFLGKWLVPVSALVVYVLCPGLLLVLLAASMRPSGETWAFLVDRRDVILALLHHFAVLAVGYASLVVLVSTVARRRLSAIVLGALVFLGGSLIAGSAMGVKGPLGDAARATSLYANAQRVLQDGLGSSLPYAQRAELPSTTAAYVVTGALFVACAVAVLRRARTSEVVS